MINSLVRNCVMPGCVTVLQNRPARCDDGINLPVDVSVKMFVVVLKLVLFWYNSSTIASNVFQKTSVFLFHHKNVAVLKLCMDSLWDGNSCLFVFCNAEVPTSDFGWRLLYSTSQPEKPRRSQNLLENKGYINYACTMISFFTQLLPDHEVVRETIAVLLFSPIALNWFR